MKRSIAILFFAFVSLIFAGCATWTADKCKSTNWDTQGYSEGSKGQANSAGVYAQKCQKHKINVNTQAYNAGYQRGLEVFCSYNSGYQHAFSGTALLSTCSAIPKYKQGYADGRKKFCTYDNGYKRGLDGKSEGNMCSGSTLQKYLAGYKKGRKKYAQQETKYLRVDLKKAQRDLNEVRDKIADKQYQLSRIPKYSREDSVIQLRSEMEYDLNNLFETRNSIRDQIETMESQLSSLERELN